VPPAVSMQDWASSGVRKFEDDGGASARRAVVEEDEEVWGRIDEKASVVDAIAIKIARLVDDAFMVYMFCLICKLFM